MLARRLARHPVNSLFVACCLFSLSGCSVTETGNPATASGTILPQTGGSVTLEAAKVELEPGDLPGDKPVEIKMTRTDRAVPSDYQGFSALYEFQPSMVFANPVEVCLPATDAPDDAQIFWSRQPSDKDNSRYDPIATTIANGVACGQVTHFSTGFVGRPTTDGGLDSLDAGQSDATADADLDSPDADNNDTAPPWTGHKVDLLFVVDDSISMQGEQANLQRNFPGLIEALRNHALGPDGSGRPCTATDTSGCRIPDVHIGVISPDLGAGAYSSALGGTCDDEGPDGHNGVLQNVASVAGCPQPSDPWISYAFDDQAGAGETNVASGNSDPIERVKEAFHCIAALGNTGCGYEQQLEAARRAVDPQPNINPGFVRDDALLAVVFLTDEDDCSVARDGLFDPLNRDLGPKNFRCFEYGIQCDGITPGVNARAAGTPSGCKPGFDWLEPVTGSSDSYEAFFKGVKPNGAVLLTALAGPSTPITVHMLETHHEIVEAQVMPSCQSGDDPTSSAFPAIRIKALIDAMGPAGHFASICADDFGPALQTLGNKITEALDGP